MASIRQAHKKNYTVITNDLAQDHSLSFAARGLLLYLLSLPDDWKIQVSHLTTLTDLKTKGVLSLLKELKINGYIHLTKLSMVSGWEYYVFEKKISEEEFKEFLRTKPLGLQSNYAFEEEFRKEQLLSNKENKYIKSNKNPLTPLKVGTAKALEKEKKTRATLMLFNKILGNKIKENFGNILGIDVVEEGVAFSFGQSHKLFKFKDENFRKDVLERLKLMKLEVVKMGL